MENPIFTYCQMAEHYPVTVFDASALIGYHKEGKVDQVLDGISFGNFLRGKMAEGNLCVIPEAIIGELRRFRTHDKGIIAGREKLIEDYREMTRDNVLNINEAEAERIARRFMQVHAEYGVSIEDLIVLGHGVRFARRGLPTAIISNDEGIANAWRDYTKENDIAPARLGFLKRRGMNEFEWHLK